MLNALDARLTTWIAAQNPWTNVYGVARTILALGMLLTLLANDTSTLFRPAAGQPDVPMLQPPFAFLSIFYWVPVEVGRWLCIAGLLAVVSGWRPRITGVVHWLVVFSFFKSVTLQDGGDQVAMALTTLLLPYTLTDPRRWHWDAPSDRIVGRAGLVRRVIALSTWLALRIQVCGIYFHAAVAKVTVAEWVDGTALYYWLNDPMLGMAPWLRPVVVPVLNSPLGVVLMTWVPLMLEMILFAALFMSRRQWSLWLAAGILFHAGIALTLGLVSFWCSMTAALILYLRHYDDPFTLQPLREVRRRVRTWRADRQPVAAAAG